jgi:hypothetical protein
MGQYKSFDEFWPHYLREHSRPETRAVHFAGITFMGACALGWVATRKSRYLAGTLAGFAPLWLAHLALEHNNPSAFDNPAWSIKAALRMYAKWLAGDLDAELRRARVESEDATKALPFEPSRQDSATEA